MIRKSAKTLSALFILFLLFCTGCKKKDIRPEPFEKEDFAMKVKDFLARERGGGNGNSRGRVDIVSNSIDYQSGFLSRLNTGKEFVSYALSAANVATDNIHRNAGKRAVFYLDKNNNIDGGSIITIRSDQNIPDNNNGLEAILNGKNRYFSGTVTVNTLNNQYIQSLTWQNGKIANSTVLSGKAVALESQTMPNAGGSPPNLNCTAWYLVTTSYYPDGHTETNSEYLYTTCGLCTPTGELQDELLDALACEPNNGGGIGYVYADTSQPCRNADSLRVNSAFISKMLDLKSKTGQSYESGYTMSSTGPSNHTYSPIVGLANDGSIDLSAINYPISGIIHNHYTGLLSIFSGGDIRAIYLLYRNGQIANLAGFTMGLVTASNTTYLLMITDPGKFLAYGNSTLYDPVTFNSFETTYRDIYKIRPSSTAAYNEETFIRFLKATDIGVTVFKGDINTFSSWTRQEADENDSIVVRLCY